jgi:hypothetical protein
MNHDPAIGTPGANGQFAAPAWTTPPAANADLPAVHAPAASHGRPFTLPSAPSAPAPAPTAAGFAAGGAAGGDGFGPGGWAAVLVALLGCCAAASMRPHRQSLALWRPLAFVSIQERPG